MTTEWRPVPDWNYEVNNHGEVRNATTKETLKHETNGHKGYHAVCLSKNGKSKKFYVHRLVAQAFLEDYSEDLQVNHINFDRSCNEVENLEMTTAQENIKWSYDAGRMYSKKIWQFTLGGEFIMQYDSITEAAKELDIKADLIGKACRGETDQAGGYRWSYIVGKERLMTLAEGWTDEGRTKGVDSLTPLDISYIKAKVDAGESTVTGMAKMFGISFHKANDIVKGEKYLEVNAMKPSTIVIQGKLF